MLREMSAVPTGYSCPPGFLLVGTQKNPKCKCVQKSRCGKLVTPASPVGGGGGKRRVSSGGKRWYVGLSDDINTGPYEAARAFQMDGFGDDDFNDGLPGWQGMGKLTSIQAGDIRRMATGILIQKYDLKPSQQMLSQKITLPSSVATAIATQYANQVQAGDVYPTVDAIASDSRLDALVQQMAPGSKKKGFLTNILPAKDIIPGIPNTWLLAGGAVIVGAVVFKKMRKKK